MTSVHSRVAARHGFRARQSIRSRLAARSRLARDRGAQSIFMFGSAAMSDRLIAAAYFTCFSRRWASLAQGPSHLEGYRAGLDEVGSPGSILDLGTGAGGSADLAAELFPQARVIGVDISRAMIRNARRAFGRDNLTYLRCDGSRLPFDDGEWEVVTMLNALVSPLEVHRVLADDGIVLLARSAHAMPSKDGIYTQRWRQVGFDVVDQAAVGGGGWQLLRKRSTAS